MKPRLLLFAAASLMLSSCVEPPTRAASTGPRGYAKTPPPGKPVRSADVSAGYYSMGGHSTDNPPIRPGETSSAYRDRLARQQRDGVPDAQVMYQTNQQDAFGRRTDSGIYRSTGGVTEEVHIGNQQIPVIPGQYGPAPTYPNVYQGGYSAPGATTVYDPYTGRMIPVRRR